jgi:predicted phage tail protein
MTNIIIHGKLSKIFGDKISINLGNFKDIISAIDSIRTGFRSEILKLTNLGCNYCIQKINSEIHILPFIGGSGKWFLIAALVIVGIAMVMTGFGAPIGTMLITIGIELAIFSLIKKKPKVPKAGEQYAGGSTFALQGSSRSYIFSNNFNAASQGNLIRIGYGKFKTGSNIVQASVKNFSTSDTFESEVYIRATEPETALFSPNYDALVKIKNIQ